MRVARVDVEKTDKTKIGLGTNFARKNSVGPVNAHAALSAHEALQTTLSICADRTTHTVSRSVRMCLSIGRIRSRSRFLCLVVESVWPSAADQVAGFLFWGFSQTFTSQIHTSPLPPSRRASLYRSLPVSGSVANGTALLFQTQLSRTRSL